MGDLSTLEVIIIAIVEGLTEFLPCLLYTSDAADE